MKVQGLLIFLVFVLCWSACKKKEVDPNITGLRYFPMEENFYRIYDVDSITIQAELEINDTAYYQIKEIQDSLFLDAGNNISMRIKRYKRLSDTLDWEISDIWTAHRNNSSAQVVEENVRKFLMALPPNNNLNWDLNAFNSSEEWNCSYSVLHESMQVEGINFDSTVTVKFDDNINLVERETGYMTFATTVGLIKSYERVLALNQVVPVDVTPDWTQIETGIELTYTIKEYGYE